MSFHVSIQRTKEDELLANSIEDCGFVILLQTLLKT